MLIMLYIMCLSGEQRKLPNWLKKSTGALLLTKLTIQPWGRLETNQTHYLQKQFQFLLQHTV